MQKGLIKGLKSQRNLSQQCFVATLHSSVPLKFCVSLEPLAHDTVQTSDETLEGLDLLLRVLVALQSFVILPKWGRSGRYPTAVSDTIVKLFCVVSQILIGLSVSYLTISSRSP